MTFLEAAYVVLKSANRPLTTGEITERALRRGLVESRGKTPERTMGAVLYRAEHEGKIRREFRMGRTQAVSGSVRWTLRP